jgi:RNA polymerase sigma factor (sigma-70 family)
MPKIDGSAGASLGEIEAVYRVRLAELRRVATAITGSREAGCDAVQEAFALAVHHRQGFRSDGSLEAWLWRIVVRSSRDFAARIAQRPSTPLDHESVVRRLDSPGDSGGAVRQLVAELPDRQRLVLFLRYYADLEYETIAEALEISSGTVGATLTQARDNLRQLMTGVNS